MSQVSPASTAPLPHTTGQSLSVLLLQLPAVGQQPSPLTQAVIGVLTHWDVQVPAF
jgi:hypothetical protein